MQYVQRSDCRAANLQSFAAARHFCSAKILAGGLRWGTGVLIAEGEVPAQRNFQRKFALRRVGSARFVVPRLAITQKYVTTLDKRILNTGQPRGARGTAVPLFREASRGTPFKRFLWATSSRRLDTALLCAAKKRGVELNQLAGFFQNQAGACRHGRQNKTSAYFAKNNKHYQRHQTSRRLSF